LAFKRGKYVNKFMPRMIFFISALVTVLFAASCSEDDINKSNENNELTAAAVSKIYRACKYPNEEFCEEACCKSAEKCNDETAFKECDLEAGEWKNGLFSDSGCISECVEDSKAPSLAESGIAQNQQTCIEGWKCLNKFDRIYRNSDCTFGETERCNSGCVNDACAKLCSPGELSCRNGILRICDEAGKEWKHHMDCEYGCENSTCLDSAAETGNETVQAPDSSEPEQGDCGAECFSVTFNYDPEGDDVLNDEHVMVENTCSFSCDLSGWEISDAAPSKPNKYKFGNFVLSGGNKFKLHTGVGADALSDLYWNRGQAVWNNNGDTLYLKNANGDLIFSKGYT